MIFSEIINNLFLILIFLLNLYLIFEFKKKIQNIDFRFIVLFLIFHYLSTYFFISNIYGTNNIDAETFFMQAKDYNFTSASFLNSRSLILFIINFFQLHYLEYYNVVILFSTLGIISILIILYSIDDLKKNKFINMCNIIFLFTPSLNIWTGTISKEVLAIMGISLLFLYRRKRNIFLLLVGFSIICLVRPFLGIILIVGFMFYQLLNKELFLTKNIVLLSLALFICTLIYTIFFNYNLENIFVVLERQINTTSRGNSMYYAKSIFSSLYHYITLGFKSNNIFMFISFVDSMIYIFFFIIIIIILFVNFNKNFQSKEFTVNLFILLFLLILLSYVTRNYGIAFRQRILLLPYLILLINISPIKIIYK